MITKEIKEREEKIKELKARTKNLEDSINALIKENGSKNAIEQMKEQILINNIFIGELSKQIMKLKDKNTPEPQ